MRKLTIKIEATEDMDRLKLEVAREDLDDEQYSFCLFKLLGELYKKDKTATLIAVDSFIDQLQERDGQ
jgi:hypothetical protein